MADFSRPPWRISAPARSWSRRPAISSGSSDRDLLEALALLRDGKPTVAALLLAGKPEALARHLPHTPGPSS